MAIATEGITTASAAEREAGRDVGRRVTLPRHRSSRPVQKCRVITSRGRATCDTISPRRWRSRRLDDAQAIAGSVSMTASPR
jgi:hypothetical protein